MSVIVDGLFLVMVLYLDNGGQGFYSKGVICFCTQFDAIAIDYVALQEFRKIAMIG